MSNDIMVTWQWYSSLLNTQRKKICCYREIYYDKLDETVNKCNNTGWVPILTLLLNIMIRILNSKLVIILKYQNTKLFLQRAALQIKLKKFLWSKKYKITVMGACFLWSYWWINYLNILWKRIAKEKSNRV